MFAHVLRRRTRSLFAKSRPEFGAGEDDRVSSEASVRRLVCMTLASTRESGRELTRSRLADEPRAASMLAARGPAPAGHAEHAEH
jgi:hypothetical protein